MIRVADAVAEIIRKSPMLDEGLSRGLINISALARDIRPRVEKRVFKEVTEGAVVMALKRLSATMLCTPGHEKIFTNMPDLMVRSNLFERTVSNSPSLLIKQRDLAALSASHAHFLTITAGVLETTIIASDALHSQIDHILDDEHVLKHIADLSSITIRLSGEILEIPGSYAQILKLIAWEGINIIEVVSTYRELTVILRQQDTDRALGALQKAFSKI